MRNRIILVLILIQILVTPDTQSAKLYNSVGTLEMFSIRFLYSELLLLAVSPYIFVKLLHFRLSNSVHIWLLLCLGLIAISVLVGLENNNDLFSNRIRVYAFFMLSFLYAYVLLEEKIDFYWILKLFSKLCLVVVLFNEILSSFNLSLHGSHNPLFKPYDLLYVSLLFYVISLNETLKRIKPINLLIVFIYIFLAVNYFHYKAFIAFLFFSSLMVFLARFGIMKTLIMSISGLLFLYSLYVLTPILDTHADILIAKYLKIDIDTGIDPISYGLYSKVGVSSDEYLSGRIGIWTQYLNGLYENLLVGNMGGNPTSHPRGITAHNILLDLGYNLGIVVSIAFIVMIFKLIRSLSNPKFFPFGVWALSLFFIDLFGRAILGNVSLSLVFFLILIFGSNYNARSNSRHAYFKFR